MTSQTKALAAQYTIDLDDVAEWVGLHYGRGFYTESAPKKREWILRYAEMHGLKSCTDKVAEAGELLIRTLAALGTLPEGTKAEHEQLIKHASLALHYAALSSPQVAQSLRTHPPEGIDLQAVHQV